MGGQKGIASFYTAFSKLVPVTVISTNNNENPTDLAAEFLPILSISKSRYFNPFFLLTLRRIIKERKATHLILENNLVP